MDEMSMDWATAITIVGVAFAIAWVLREIFATMRTAMESDQTASATPHPLGVGQASSFK
jgi:hypothetical protein